MVKSRLRRARTTCAVLFGLLLSACTPGQSSAQSAPAVASSPGPTARGTASEPAAPGVVLEHTERREITSAKIGQRYDLFVSLPGDYAASGKRYPVLYVLDGWHFPLMAYLQDNNSFSKRMPPIIIVNIGQGDDAIRLRDRDFTPKPMASKQGSGGAPAFLAFLEGDIIPFIERTYRTIPTDRAILGHSLGGLFALYAMEQRPGLFQRIVAASPARLAENREIVASLDRMGASGTSVRLDVSMGEEEPGVAGVAAFASRLDQAKLPNVAHRFTVYLGENHNSVRLASFPSGLYWVYRPAGSP